MTTRFFKHKRRVVAGILLIGLVCFIVVFGYVNAAHPNNHTGTKDSVSNKSAPTQKYNLTLPSGNHTMLNDLPGLSKVATESGEVSTRYEQTELLECATSILQTYQSRQDCALAHSGYLDICGNVWSCVLCGKGWVDVVFVSQCKKDQCEVKTVHLTAAQWASRYANLAKSSYVLDT